MAEDIQQKPFVVKRIKKRHGGGHPSGVWKIAYADFVTAMMAFFLLMWLLSSTDAGTLNGVSEYFKTPLKVPASVLLSSHISRKNAIIAVTKSA